MNKVNIHKQICEQLHSTYIAKNSDYGDSYEQVRSKYPNSILIRLNDKLNRLESLYRKDKINKVKDESVKDTLLDLANYCILELVAMEIEKVMEKTNMR